MKRKAIWAIGILAITALAVLALTGAQTNVAQDATIQDLLDLLLTEDGESRLDHIRVMLDDIDSEVDLIHSVAEKMLEEQYGIFEAQEWTLSDIKYQLNQIEAQLDAIEACCCSP
jgi:peptidoglycan hydrolase CwlO-like protein